MSNPYCNLFAAILVQAEKDLHDMSKEAVKEDFKGDVGDYLRGRWFLDICDYLDLQPNRTTIAITEGWGLQEARNELP